MVASFGAGFFHDVGETRFFYAVEKVFWRFFEKCVSLCCLLKKMGLPDSYSKFFQPPSMLRLLEDSTVSLPEPIRMEVQQLKDKLQTILLGDYQAIETALPALLPKVWALRMQALPFLAKIDIKQTIYDVSAHFLMLRTEHPELSGPLDKLQFGLEQMKKFISVLMETNPEIFEAFKSRTNHEAPNFETLVNSFHEGGTDEALRFLQILQSSLMMELLLFAIDLTAEHQLPLSIGVLHELNYQSAVTVESYGVALIGMQSTEMPWYQPTQNKLQQLLYAAPVADAEQLRFLEEKRAHFNAWR